MADVHIKGIKLLHKRYSTAEWTSGTTVGGKQVIPKLAQGEIGLNTNTLEVKVGTNSSEEQLWSDARLISAGVSQTVEYFYKDGTKGTTPKDGENYVCTTAGIATNDNGTHAFSATFKEISLVNPVPEVPTLGITSGTASTPTTDTIDVVTGATAGGTKGHSISLTKSKAATKSYVDGRKLTITDNGTGDFITGITESNANGNHTITVSRGSVNIDFPKISVDKTGTGTFITGIDVDETDDHKLKVTTGNAPSLTGGSVAAADATVAGGVTVSGHAVTVAKKTIKSGDSVVKVVGDTSNITISADTYTKGDIDKKINDLQYDSMLFKGVLKSGDTLATITQNMNGWTYKVGEAGTYGGQAAKVGDMFIAHWDKTTSKGTWEYIPSADDTQTADTWRGVKVGTWSLGNNINSGDLTLAAGDGASVSGSGNTVTISHSDTSSASNLTKKARTYVDGLTFDTFGHVTGYTVGTETDQTIPTGSGSVAEGAAQVVASVALSSNHKLSGTKKTITAGTKMAVEDAKSKITISHSSTTRKDSTSSASPAHAETFTAIDSVSTDATGHVTAVNVKTVTLPEVPNYVDTNTTYDLNATAGTTTAGATSVNINLKGSDTTTDTITVKADASTTAPTDGLTIKNVSNAITITGKATASLLGMIRAAAAIDDSAETTVKGKLKNYSGKNNDRLYGVNVTKDGTAFVEIPWTDTISTYASIHSGNNGKSLSQDLYAFGTDAYGHVISAGTVAILDGNLA